MAGRITGRDVPPASSKGSAIRHTAGSVLATGGTTETEIATLANNRWFRSDLRV
jgi:hypothetical protein